MPRRPRSLSCFASRHRSSSQQATPHRSTINPCLLATSSTALTSTGLKEPSALLQRAVRDWRLQPFVAATTQHHVVYDKSKMRENNVVLWDRSTTSLLVREDERRARSRRRPDLPVLEEGDLYISKFSPAGCSSLTLFPRACKAATPPQPREPLSSWRSMAGTTLWTM
eukprot:763323-Hanusia_phi.AAC.2